MGSILVIADDFTGAAEIAGVGLRHGLTTCIVRRGAGIQVAELVVIDTDSRSLNDQDAASAVINAIRLIGSLGFDWIYKKIDSVMRGPVLAEIEAMQTATGKSSALLLPANPSRGRTIQGGEYRIDGVPLHQTSFADDPEHPARSSNVLELLGYSAQLAIRFSEPTCKLNPGHLIAAEASSAADVNAWAGRVESHVLPVGGADFFAALMAHHGHKLLPPMPPVEIRGTRLFVCGSAAASSRTAIQQARSIGVPVIEGSMKSRGSIAIALAGRGCAIVTIPPTGSLHELADAVAGISIDELFIEGGATAGVILDRLGWRQFAARAELTPGVVQLDVMNSPQTRVTVKPGSYPWPATIWPPTIAPAAP